MTCPKCGYTSPPPEPPVGTWVKDKYGATHEHAKDGWRAGPGFMAAGKWEAMWNARGPLVECGAYGIEEDEA